MSEIPDPNPMPDVNLFPRLQRVVELASTVGRVLFNHIHSPGLSDHFTTPNTGAAPMLDRELYDTPDVPVNIDLGQE